MESAIATPPVALASPAAQLYPTLTPAQIDRIAVHGQAGARWARARAPHLLETSLPGVFAVGDVRSVSLKRVASAVGEGSIAIAAVHQVLAE